MNHWKKNLWRTSLQSHPRRRRRNAEFVAGLRRRDDHFMPLASVQVLLDSLTRTA
jgi:hypothetical protein